MFEALSTSGLKKENGKVTIFPSFIHVTSPHIFLENKVITLYLFTLEQHFVFHIANQQRDAINLVYNSSYRISATRKYQNTMFNGRKYKWYFSHMGNLFVVYIFKKCICCCCCCCFIVIWNLKTKKAMALVKYVFQIPKSKIIFPLYFSDIFSVFILFGRKNDRLNLPSSDAFLF